MYINKSVCIPNKYEADMIYLIWKYNFFLLAQEVGFHFLFEKVLSFQISYIIWDIIPDLCSDVRNTFFWDSQLWFRHSQIVYEDKIKSIIFSNDENNIWSY